MTDKIERVKKLSKSVGSFQRVIQEQDLSRGVADKAQFDSLMAKKTTPSKEIAQIDQEHTRVKPSIMDEAAKINKRIDRNMDMSSNDLVAQAEEAIKRIDGLKTQLGQDNVQIQGSVQYLLKNKLADINENLKVAFQRAGLEYVPPSGIGERNPAKRFLDMLAHGQSQLESLSSHVSGLAENKTEISPADFLALQMKVNHVQQELEFFTALLSKSLESTKTLMNVQV